MLLPCFHALAHYVGWPQKRRVFIDVSFTSQLDNRTGIQRVVRNITKACDNFDDLGVTILPVVVKKGQLFYAHTLAESLALRTPHHSTGEIRPSANDCLILLDSGWAIDHVYEGLFPKLRRRGTRIVSVIYDLIPIRLPELVHSGTRVHFSRWLEQLRTGSDHFIGISAAVAEDLRAYLAETPNRGGDQTPVGVFHLGADERELRASGPEADSSTTRAFAASAAHRFLMVGTLEPRKGYGETLDAFDQLIQEGEDCALCIVGKFAWGVEAIAERIRQHPQFGCRLYWMDAADDAELATFYTQAHCLIAASRAEGFGLPLIEAAQTGLALLCSDLPVFHEVCGPHACYFRVGDSAALAKVWKAWIHDHSSGTHRSAADLPFLSWEQSARQLLKEALRAQPSKSGVDSAPP